MAVDSNEAQGTDGSERSLRITSRCVVNTLGGSNRAGTDTPAPARANEQRPEPRVLVVEPGTILAELYETWLAEEFRVERAASEADVVDTLDLSIGVAVLAPSVPNDVAERVVSVVLESYPHCLVVDVLPRSESDRDLEVAVDAQLQDPIDGETLRETVREQLRRAEYGAALYRHVQLATLVAARETRFEPDELAEDETYARLQRKLAAERHHLDRLAAQLDAADFEAWLDAFDARTSHVSTADPDASSDARGPKYLPNACPGCGLQWGVEHGERLGLGYTRLGSHIYKCRNCGEVVKNDGGGEQRVPW